MGLSCIPKPDFEGCDPSARSQVKKGQEARIEQEVIKMKKRMKLYYLHKLKTRRFNLVKKVRVWTASRYIWERELCEPAWDDLPNQVHLQEIRPDYSSQIFSNPGISSNPKRVKNLVFVAFCVI